MWRCTTVSSEKLRASSIFQIDATWIALTALYLLALAMLGRRVTAEARRPDRNNRALRFWTFGFCVFLILLFNRLFNLQFLLTLTARCAAFVDGWYGDRRPFQFALIVFLAVAGSVFLMRAYFRRSDICERLTLLGLVALIVFGAIRALSFHWVDAALSVRLFGLTANGLLEAAALAPAFFGAAQIKKPSPVRGRGLRKRRE